MAKASTDFSYQSQPDHKDLGHIPGDYGLPYIGKAISFLADLHGSIDKQYKQYGPVSRMRMGGQNGLLIVGPDLYQEIYLDPQKNYSAKMGYDLNLGNFYPDTILLSDFEQHRPARRMFQNAFKNDAMRTYIEMLNPICADNIALMGNEKNFVFFPAIKTTLLDVASKVFIGMDELGSESDALAEAFVHASEGMLGLVKAEIPGTKYKKGRDGVRFLHDYFGRLVEQRRAGEGKDTFSDRKSVV